MVEGMKSGERHKKFIGIGKIVQCPKCAVKGKLRLTGGRLESPTVLKC